MVMYEHLRNIWLQYVTEDFLLRLAQTDPLRLSGRVYRRFMVQPGISETHVKAMCMYRVYGDISIRRRAK